MMRKMSEMRVSSTRNVLMGGVLALVCLPAAYGQTAKPTAAETKATRATVTRVPKTSNGPHTTTADKLPRHASVEMPIVKGANTSQELNRLERQNIKVSGPQSGPRQTGTSPRSATESRKGQPEPQRTLR